MVDYYYEYGPGFYYQTQGLNPGAVEAEVLKITKGKRSGIEEEYRQAASRVPGYNASQAERDRAAIRAEFEAHEREQSALKGSFMGREAQARVYGGTPQKQIVGIEVAKAAELQAARAETARRQSEQATSPTEALAIQRMLRSPTAQFASQEVAQRGYELASRYDRSFAPEQVRATLAPQYQPQAPPQAPSRFFYPAPSEQAGIKPSFPSPARPRSIAERAAFESRTRGFYTYGAVRKLEAVSSKLQEDVESAMGYDDRSSIPLKFAVGVGRAAASIPAFAGQVAGVGEAIIRYPSASLRGLPTGFKIYSSQIAEQIKTQPVEFVGSLAGYVAIGKLQSKFPTIKTPTYREMFGGKGPSPFEGMIRTPTGTEAYRAMFGAPKGVSLKEPVGIEKLIPRAPTYRETFGGVGETPSFRDIAPRAPTYREIFGSGERVKLSTEIQPYIRPTLTEVMALAKSEAATSYFGGTRKTFVSKVESPYANKMNIDVTQASIRKADFRRSMEAPVTKATRPAPRQMLETRIEKPPQEYVSGAKAESLADVLYEATLEKQIRVGGKGYVSEARLKEARSIDEIMIQQAKKQKQLARIKQEESVVFTRQPSYKPITKQISEVISLQKTTQKPGTKIIPMAVSISAQKTRFKQVSEEITKQIPAQITRQATRQRQTPILVQRERQKQPLIPVGITVQTPKLKTPTPTRPKIEIPIIPQRPPQITPEKIKTPMRPREPFTPETPRIPKRNPPTEPPRQYKKSTSEILKSSSILIGARKYTTTLGGKTFEQLTQKAKKLRSRRKK